MPSFHDQMRLDGQSRVIGLALFEAFPANIELIEVHLHSDDLIQRIFSG
jgi:hypothetical protein